MLPIERISSTTELHDLCHTVRQACDKLGVRLGKGDKHVQSIVASLFGQQDFNRALAAVNHQSKKAEEEHNIVPVPVVTVPSQMIEDLFDHSIRVEACLHLGTQLVDPDELPSIIKDEFNLYFDDMVEALGLDVEASSDMDFNELMSDIFTRHRKRGFLVRFATPVIFDVSEDGEMYSSSWGCFCNQWIYGETMAECCEKGLAWGESYVDGVIEQEVKKAKQRKTRKKKKT